MEWISTKDQLPDQYVYVILFANKIKDVESGIFEDEYYITIGYRHDNDYSCAFDDGCIPFTFEDITHWMPLPKPPI